MANVVFSAEIEDTRGTIGSTVFTKARSGNTVRSCVVGFNPRTPAQASIRANMAHAVTAYTAMTTAQLAAWAAYAAAQTKRNPLSGRTYVPAPNTVFVGLAAKFLQINPGGTIPVTPPSAAFAGDTIAITTAGGTGTVTFTGTAANGTNIKTEFLLQPLKSHARKPSAGGYRSKGFDGLATAGHTFSVTVPVGFYAPAYRFVNTLTGQESLLVTLPMVQVS